MLDFDEALELMNKEHGLLDFSKAIEYESVYVFIRKNEPLTPSLFITKQDGIIGVGPQFFDLGEKIKTHIIKYEE